MLFSCNPTTHHQDNKQYPSEKEERNALLSRQETIVSGTIIVDSSMTFEEAIAGTKAPLEIIADLVLIDVEYYSTDNRLHRGQLVIHKEIEKDIREIFEFMREIRFPVYQAVPIVAYNWDDNLSMAANNTSSFCFRTVDKTNRLSRHATGKAIDINPYFNPLIWKPPYEDRANMPDGATYDVNRPGTFHPEHPVVKAFRKRKFVWGYYLKNYYDNHHFHKGNPPSIPSTH